MDRPTLQISASALRGRAASGAYLRAGSPRLPGLVSSAAPVGRSHPQPLSAATHRQPISHARAGAPQRTRRSRLAWAPPGEASFSPLTRESRLGQGSQARRPGAHGPGASPSYWPERWPRLHAAALLALVLAAAAAVLAAGWLLALADSGVRP